MPEIIVQLSHTFGFYPIDTGVVNKNSVRVHGECSYALLLGVHVFRHFNDLATSLTRLPCKARAGRYRYTGKQTP